MGSMVQHACQVNSGEAQQIPRQLLHQLQQLPHDTPCYSYQQLSLPVLQLRRDGPACASAIYGSADQVIVR